jgi:vitamin B12 transporter
MRQILLVAAILGGWMPVLAQDNPPQPAAPAAPPASPPAFHDTIVVTAGLAPEAVVASPGAVTVIDRQEIEARQSESLSDLIAVVPGMTVTQAGSPGQQTSVFLRGADSDQTLLLWNGIELNDPFFGGANWQLVPSEGIERIEVLRGPGSAIYGSNAVGGVVQVITGRERGTTVRLEGGEHGYARGSAVAGFDSGPVHFDLAGHLRGGEGEFANDRYTSDDLSARATWNLAPATSLGLLARADEAETGIPFSSGAPTFDRRISWKEREVAVPFRAERGPWEVDAQLSDFRLTSAYRDPADPGGFTASDTDAAALRGRTVAAYRASDDLRLAAGAEGERLEVTEGSNFGSDLAGRRQRTWAAFGEAGYELGQVHLEGGLRRDQNDVYGGQTSLRLGGVARLSRTTRLRASYGEAFRAPFLGELYFPGSGNPDLRPETSASAELGLEQDAGPFRFGLTGFAARQRNLIDFDFATSRDVNIGRSQSRGVEGEVTLRRRGLFVRANATYLDTEDRATGLALNRRPRQSANLVVMLTPGGRWTLAWTERYVGERPDVDPVTFGRRTNPGYLRTDLAASYAVRPWLSPYARVDNLADRRYAEALGFPAPGRTVAGGVAIRF